MYLSESGPGRGGEEAREEEEEEEEESLFKARRRKEARGVVYSVSGPLSLSDTL